MQSGQLRVGELVERVARQTGSTMGRVRKRWRQFYSDLHRADLLLLRDATVPSFAKTQLLRLDATSNKSGITK